MKEICITKVNLSYKVMKSEHLTYVYQHHLNNCPCSAEVSLSRFICRFVNQKSAQGV